MRSRQANDQKAEFLREICMLLNLLSMDSLLFIIAFSYFQRTLRNRNLLISPLTRRLFNTRLDSQPLSECGTRFHETIGNRAYQEFPFYFFKNHEATQVSFIILSYSAIFLYAKNFPSD